MSTSRKFKITNLRMSINCSPCRVVDRTESNVPKTYTFANGHKQGVEIKDSPMSTNKQRLYMSGLLSNARCEKLYKFINNHKRIAAEVGYKNYETSDEHERRATWSKSVLRQCISGRHGRRQIRQLCVYTEQNAR